MGQVCLRRWLLQGLEVGLFCLLILCEPCDVPHYGRVVEKVSCAIMDGEEVAFSVLMGLLRIKMYA